MIRKKRSRRETFSIIYYIPQAAESKPQLPLKRADAPAANFLTHRSGCGYLTAKQVFACGQHGSLGNTVFFHTGDKTQFLICQMIPSFQAIETNKEKQNKTWSVLLRSDEGRHFNQLVHEEDEINQPHTVSCRKTQATRFFSLGQNFKATFPHASSCPLQVLF